MKEFRSFLVVIPAMMARPDVLPFVQNAMVLGLWLRCEVHFLANPTEAVPLDDAVSEFRRTHTHSPSTLVIRPTPDSPSAGILEAIRKHSCDLVVMQDSVLLHQTKGIDERMLLEESTVPVLLIPRAADFSRQPPNAFLAPLSGEQCTSEAAATGLVLARQTGAPIDFLHVTNPATSCTCGQAMEGLGDELHHEYTQLVEKIASEASPYSSPEERARIRHFYHSEGFTTEQISKVLDKSPGSVLILEWSGTLAAGRAETIKDILKKKSQSILFVKKSQKVKSTLRVGKNIHAA